MSMAPEDLGDEQKIRLVDLKNLFEQAMPANTSPLPTVRTTEERPLATTPASSSTPPTSSMVATHSTASTSYTTFNKQPKGRVKTKDQETQTSAPAFQRVESPAPVHTRVIAGPFHQVEGRGVRKLLGLAQCWQEEDVQSLSLLYKKRREPHLLG